MYFVYLMSSQSHTLYVGMTNNLERRVAEHKSGTNPGFTSRYNVNKLVWMEDFADVHEAIAREKQIKGWSRAKKIRPIEAANPLWVDLAEEWPSFR